MNSFDRVNLMHLEREAVIRAVHLLKSELPVSKVILFGSKARGTGNTHSDIDILVLTSCPVTWDLRHNISEKLAEINVEKNVMLSSIVVQENEWNSGLTRYMPIYDEVQRDGCEV